MKKLLLTVLASLSLVVTACTPAGGSSDPSSSEAPSSEAGPQVVTIKEAIEWDLENAAPYLDGQVVRLEDVSVTSNYGTSSLSVCWADIAEDDTINDFVSMEVITTEKTSFGWKDVVNVTGTVTSTNGRPHLKDATVEWAVDEETSKGAGTVIYSRYLTRAYWDHYASRAVSSSYFEATLQLASLPGTLTAGQGGSFQVVYPGEKLEISDDNWNIIDVMIPTLSEAEATMYNEAFEGLEVGDGVLMFAQSYFDSYPKALMVPETLMITNGWVPTELDIFQSWAETEAHIAETYQLDASFVPDTFEDDSIYAWTVDDSLLADYDCLNINAGTDEAAAVYEKFTDILDADETFTLVNADVEAEDGSVQSFYVVNPVVNEAGELTDYDASIWVCDYTTQVILQIECPSLAPKDARYDVLSAMLYGATGQAVSPNWDAEEECWYFVLTASATSSTVASMYEVFTTHLLPLAGEVVAIDGEFDDQSTAEIPYIYNAWMTADELYIYDVYVMAYDEDTIAMVVSAYENVQDVDYRVATLQAILDAFEVPATPKYVEAQDLYYIQIAFQKGENTLASMCEYFTTLIAESFGAVEFEGAYNDDSENAEDPKVFNALYSETLNVVFEVLAFPSTSNDGTELIVVQVVTYYPEA